MVIKPNFCSYTLSTRFGQDFEVEVQAGKMLTVFLLLSQVALFDMPNLNRFDILSISIFCKSALSISISISIFSNMTISILILISIFFKSVDISTIDMSYRYIEQG